MEDEREIIRNIIKLIRLLKGLVFFVAGVALLVVGYALGFFGQPVAQGSVLESSHLPENSTPPAPPNALWQAPDSTTIPAGAEGEKIRYGKELIAHTSVYLGPEGKVLAMSNGMNCQNCHLKAGTVPYGNNFGRVASAYPKIRKRSGKMVDYEARINDCFERSLNGQKLAEHSPEMQAMVAYLKWVGGGVGKGEELPGFGRFQIEPLDRPADPKRGKQVFGQYCVQCHGPNGEGQLATNGREWTYPPLYGEGSYNIGAGLYRVSGFAAFVKANMPYGVTFENTLLTDEEAWDVAAYVNSMRRPKKDLSQDWPDISQKPVDHPFGPYADSFTEQQHKYGPFDPMKVAN
ncbi:c-type cytochrome [Persicitalea sp.]|uniref:c-type cytochrome n=1 Tax=Persicitalea sp. TaxID=3100273 RepID=UPI0035949285